jgi:hypothetical protein
MSFCDISFNRKNGKVTNVLDKEGRESNLYPLILSKVEQNPSEAYRDNKVFFDTLINQGKLLGSEKRIPISADEMALGLYSIAYNSRATDAEAVRQINQKGLSVFSPTKKETPVRTTFSNAKDFLSDVSKNGSTMSNRLLAKRLLGATEKNNATIVLEKTDGAMTYDSRDNTIRVSPETDSFTVEEYEQSLLHEIVHSLTVQVLKGNKKAIKEDQKFYSYMSSLIDELEKRVPKDKMNDDLFYAFNHKGANKDSKIAEFIAEYLSNPDFSLWVDKRLSDKKNFVQKLVDFISVLLGNKLIAPAIYDYIYKSEQTVRPTKKEIVEDVEQKYQEIVKKYARLGNKINPNLPYGTIVSAVAEVNKSYGAKVIVIYEAPDGSTRVKIDRSVLDKINKESQKLFRTQTRTKNMAEAKKENRPRIVDNVEELSFLTNEERENAEALLLSGRFPVQCGI